MPFAHKLIPTTDANLITFAGQGDEGRLADFIMKYRDKFKFRIQSSYGGWAGHNPGSVNFYSDIDTAKLLVTRFWDFLYNIESVDLSVDNYDKNVIICKRLPHNKYKYQVHVNGYLHKKIDRQEREAIANLLLPNEGVKIASQGLRQYLEGEKNHCWGGYFYIEDEKMLSAIYMISQKTVDKIKRYHVHNSSK